MTKIYVFSFIEKHLLRNVLMILISEGYVYFHLLTKDCTLMTKVLFVSMISTFLSDFTTIKINIYRPWF